MVGMKIRWKTVGLSAFAVAVIGGVTVLSQTGPIFPTSEVEAPASTVIVDESPEPTFTPTPTVTPTPTPTQEPVVEAPAPPPPPVRSGAPSGTPLPFYPSSDPENAEGGQYADPGSFCASGSGSTVNGVPVCD